MLVKTNNVNIIEGKKHFVKEQKEARQLEKGMDRESLRHDGSVVEVHSANRWLIAIPVVK
jgi:hypothetical protein